MMVGKTTDWSRTHIEWKTDLVRFLRSPHCRDLLLIAVAAPTLVVAIVVLGNSLSGEVIAAFVAVAAAAMAWAFQSANLRFGAADIFASEILTLCRISAVVGYVQNLADAYEAKRQTLQPTQSTQDYVVIFHNNSKDLEILDGNVVSWVTEFYVYFKAMIDSASRLPRHDAEKPLSEEDAGLYRDVLFNVIYMAFLMFESGRQALTRLIDDRNTRQEAALTALVSEIQAYSFLYREFSTRPKDIRKQRIDGRLPQYEALMKSIMTIAKPEPGSDLQCQKIHDLAQEVLGRWREGGCGAAD
jgi:hypothetical protein